MAGVGYTNIPEGNDVENGAKPSFKKSKTVDQSAFSRAQYFISELNAPEANSPLKRGIACFLKYAAKPLILVVMFYIWLFKKLYWLYQKLPINYAKMVLGVGLCFFGGVWCFLLSAYEAAKNFGGQALLEELTIIWEEAQRANTASEEDDKLDADENGVADVKEMTTNQLISHKAKIGMAAVSDPERMMKALQFLFTVQISVIATLKFEFARAVAIALGVANLVQLPLTRLLGPLLAMAMGKDIQHWIPAIIGTIVKIIAVLVAAKIQQTISAFYAGLKGAAMFAEGLISILGEAGIMDKCPDWIAPKPFDANLSYLDEVIGFPLGAIGFLWQFKAIWLEIVPMWYPNLHEVTPIGWVVDVLCLPFNLANTWIQFQVLAP